MAALDIARFGTASVESFGQFQCKRIAAAANINYARQSYAPPCESMPCRLPARLFRSSALVSGLVTEQQLEEATALVRGGSASSSQSVTTARDEHVAAKMVELDWITQYQADQLLNGRTRFNLGTYIITDFIGRGGMGDVFKAEHNLMGREVAVKVLTRQRSTPEAEANFQREIRLQAKLDHPNLVRAYDAGHDGNVYYLVVEYVPGTDLRRLVRTQGKLDMEQAATVIMQAAQGLHHAHTWRPHSPGREAWQSPGHARGTHQGVGFGAGWFHGRRERRSACREDRRDG